MAAKTKAEKSKLLLDAGVKLKGDENAEALDALIKEHLNVDAEKSPDENDNLEAPAKAKRGKEEIAFHLHNGEKRTFTKDVHGEDFADIADEFHKTNAHKIHTRKDDGK